MRFGATHPRADKGGRFCAFALMLYLPVAGIPLCKHWLPTAYPWIKKQRSGSASTEVKTIQEVLVAMPATAIKRHTELYEAVYKASLKEEAGI